MKLLNATDNQDSTPTAGSDFGSPGIAIGQSTGKHWVAYAGTYLFTLMLYLRPNELFPEIFGTLSIIKFIAITALLAYTLGKLSSGEPLTIWPIEVKAVMAMVALSLLIMPFSAAPNEGWDMFNDTYSKVVLIFLLMINLVDTRQRLISLFNLIIAGGIWVAYFAIQIYIEGEDVLRAKGGLTRIAGVGGGMFGNPNDLANALDMLIPIAVAMGMCRKGVVRLWYWGIAVLFAISVTITYSRGAFLGLMTIGVFLALKLGRGRWFKMIIVGSVVVAILSVASPGGFGKRVATILSVDSDKTGSSHQRRELLKRGLALASVHPGGVGMGNYHIYSLNEEKAHNAYIETSVELGFLGLIAYLFLNFAPIFRLRRFERELGKPTNEREEEAYFLCVGLQCTLIAYLVCSFFASIQYYWFLYYPVAHAIAFCRIYRREQTADSTSQELAPKPADGTGWVKGGTLWQPSHAGILWSNVYQQATKNFKRRLEERAG